MNETIKEARKQLKYKSGGLPFRQLLLTDILAMTFALGPGLVAWIFTVFVVVQSFQFGHAVLGLVIAPLIMIFSFLIMVWFFRLFIPKMRPGVFSLGFSKGFAAWYLTMCLGHSVRIFGLMPFFFTFYITKYLYWRAMGAKIAYGINSSLFLTIVDYPLITIGKQCSFGAYVHIACHTYLGNKLLLAPVTIEDNVYIGMNTAIGPKTKIGEGSWIGFSNRLLQDTIPANTKIDNFEWEYGNPKKRETREKTNR